MNHQEYYEVFPPTTDKKYTGHFCSGWRNSSEEGELDAGVESKEHRFQIIRNLILKNIGRGHQTPSGFIWGMRTVKIIIENKEIDVTPLLVMFEPRVHRKPKLETLFVDGITFQGSPIQWEGCIGNNIDHKFMEEFGRIEQYSYSEGDEIKIEFPNDGGDMVRKLYDSGTVTDAVDVNPNLNVPDIIQNENADENAQLNSDAVVLPLHSNPVNLQLAANPHQEIEETKVDLNEQVHIQGQQQLVQPPNAQYLLFEQKKELENTKEELEVERDCKRLEIAEQDSKIVYLRQAIEYAKSQQKNVHQGQKPLEDLSNFKI